MCTAQNVAISKMLADCGLTKSFIYDLEKKRSSPSCERIAIIAEYLDCSVDYLLGRIDIPKPLAQAATDTAVRALTADPAKEAILQELSALSVEELETLQQTLAFIRAQVQKGKKRPASEDETG